MSKVVSIGGAPVAALGTPDVEIVALLERHLAEAQAGKTTAVAIVSVDRDGWVLTGAAFPSRRFSLLGGLSSLQHELNVSIYEDKTK